MTQFTFKTSAGAKAMLKTNQYEPEYLRFADKCRQLQVKLKEQGPNLTNCQLDNLLIGIANERLREKRRKSLHYDQSEVQAPY